MVFSSTLFIFTFLPVTLLGHLLLKGKWKNYWLIVMSLVFCGWTQQIVLVLLAASIAINYSGALIISKISQGKKTALTVTVLANFAMLFYFKYFSFLQETIRDLFMHRLEVWEIVLPIGISFFTFQGVSYVIDVYRGDVEVQKNIFKLTLYIVLFPQLIAGPIVRYKDIAEEIDNRRVSLDDFTQGIERFIIGLSKKTIIANSMAIVVDQIWANGPLYNNWMTAWFGSIAYTLQIYYDFSGYSDMAIGIGRMLGFHFGENFNLPYISKSITEFWRRWHISLSSWFRDYVYIPLGGNRKNVYLNLGIVFLLTGIWHGAAWNFVLWGIWNGVFIIGERIAGRKSGITRWNAVSSALTLLVVNLGWVLFRAPSIRDAAEYVGIMFGAVRPDNILFDIRWYADSWNILIMIIGIAFASSLPSIAGKWISEKIDSKCAEVLKYIVLLLMFAFSVTRVVSGTYNPFIYFRF